MENTSKALLIAAAVLIAILLLSFAIIMLRPSMETAKTGGGIGESLVAKQQEVASKYASSFDKTGVGGATPEGGSSSITGAGGSYSGSDIQEDDNTDIETPDGSNIEQAPEFGGSGIEETPSVPNAGTGDTGTSGNGSSGSSGESTSSGTSGTGGSTTPALSGEILSERSIY